MSETPSAAASSRSKPYDAYFGYIYIGLAAVLWGVSASLGRAAFTERLLPGSGIRNVSPLILSQARTTFSFLVVLVALLIRRGWRQLRLPWHDLLRVIRSEEHTSELQSRGHLVCRL